MHTEKSLATILAETKAEFTQFVTTRLNILKAEMEEKIRAWKSAIPLLIAALAFLLAGWMALTFALIALLHALFFPSAYAWLWSGLIVAAVYLALGVVLGRLAYAEVSSVSLTPTRTMNVLKQDQVWIQNEARTA
ncbi:MAG TPA: phage holin family protein [Candidatus Angelobacter sp.]|nr:phage holin family protein [Candidatus Angelobacter sp.]